jgi:pyruvate dehydrogenase E1 component alpha subunit
MSYTKELLHESYKTMKTIRMFEERCEKEFTQGNIPGFVHLYAGQEAVAVGACSHLSIEDKIASTHRGHGHCIAKGCDVRGMMHEIMGKADGLCKGKGGSMHIADLSKGMLGANAIVGGGPPTVVGAALSAKTLGTKNVAVAFSGDGASNQGTTFEAMNMAVVLKVPAIFLFENGEKLNFADAEIDVDPGKKDSCDWKYKVFIRLNDDQIEVFTKSPVTDSKLYIYTAEYNTKYTERWRQHLICLINDTYKIKD